MQQKFWSQGIFTKKSVVQISYLEMARELNVSKVTAKRYIKLDVENGFIEKRATEYKCKKYNPLLCGRNIYTLTKKGRSFLNASKRGGGSEKGAFVTTKFLY